MTVGRFVVVTIARRFRISIRVAPERNPDSVSLVVNDSLLLPTVLNQRFVSLRGHKLRKAFFEIFDLSPRVRNRKIFRTASPLYFTLFFPSSQIKSFAFFSLTSLIFFYNTINID